ncbi:MAG: hypothetical protein ACR2LC_08620 [Pyrinomonadaceae bacterium]
MPLNVRPLHQKVGTQSFTGNDEGVRLTFKKRQGRTMSRGLVAA